MVKIRSVKLNKKKAFQRIVRGHPQTFNVKSAQVVLKAGREVGQHSTKFKEELILVLEGKGKLMIKGCKSKIMEPLRVYYLGPDIIHNVINTGTKDLRYVYVVVKV